MRRPNSRAGIHDAGNCGNGAVDRPCLRAGCCIGDGAVIDRQFGTTDVFIYFPLSGLDARYKSRFGLVK